MQIRSDQYNCNVLTIQIVNKGISFGIKEYENLYSNQVRRSKDTNVNIKREDIFQFFDLFIEDDPEVKPTELRYVTGIEVADAGNGQMRYNKLSVKRNESNISFSFSSDFWYPPNLMLKVHLDLDHIARKALTIWLARYIVNLSLNEFIK